MNFWISGDTHSDFTKFNNFKPAQDTETAIIILGDDGCNFFGNERDKKVKEIVSSYPCRFYMLRGNHAMRPQNVDGMKTMYDHDVEGEVYYEEEYLNIRYFKDFGEYCFGDYTALVIGGAYSVDKNYRLSRGWTWIADEQLNEDERNACTKLAEGKYYDFVLTHTCPRSFQPVDMFLPYIDQKQVDKTMEKWLEELKDKIDYGVWCFGHFHADRAERPCVQMFYNNIESLDALFIRWAHYKKTKEIDSQIKLGPKFYE